MRFRRRAALGILLCLIFSGAITARNANGQSTQIDQAQTALVQAFGLVQLDDLAGASQAQISDLIDNLNLALEYANNATLTYASNTTASDIYARKSASISNQTSVDALSTYNAVHRQLFLNQITAYSASITAGFLSALLIMEFHRLGRFVNMVRRRRKGLVRN